MFVIGELHGNLSEVVSIQIPERQTDREEEQEEEEGGKQKKKEERQRWRMSGGF